MKIALLFAGQPRYLDEGYQNIYNNILSKYDVDCFVHTWWDQGLSGKRLEFYPTLTYNRTYFYKENVLETIMSLYQPKVLMHQKQKEFTILQANYGIGNPLTPYSQWYSVMKVNDLKNEYVKSADTNYDLVIRCRFDIDLMRFNLNLEDYINSPFLYAKTGCHAEENYHYIVDHFALASPKVMDAYCSLYPNIQKYYDEGIGQSKHGMVAENLITYHLNSENIKFKDIDRSKFDMDILKL